MTAARSDLLLALGAATVFTFESWAFGPHSWMYAYGAGLETLPAHLALQYGDRLFSPWAPFVASGVDRFAFWGNADPLNWETLFVALGPPWLANGLHRFTQYFIAVFFATRVGREQLSLDRWHAALAGILYAAFSYFTFGEMLALPALPLFLWLLARAGRWPSAPWSALAAGLGFSSFTTFTHSVPYLAVLGVLWAAVVRKDTTPRAAAAVACLVAGMSLGDAPQLFAALAHAPFSHRAGLAPETLGWTLDELFYRQLRFDYFNQDEIAKRIAWDLPLPLLTAGAAITALRWRFRAHRTASAEAYLRLYAIYLLLSQRWLFVTVQNFAGDALPWVHGVFMGRFFDLPASFLIASLLALLASELRAACGSRLWARRTLAASVLALVAFLLLRPKLFLLYRNGVDGWGQFNYSMSAVDRIARAEVEPFRVASVLPLQPSYAYAQGLEAADGWANLYPRAYREYWLRVLAPLFARVPAARQIFAPDQGRPQDHYIFLGADLAHPEVGLLPGEDAQRAAREGFDVERRFDLKLLGLLNVKYLLSEFPLQGEGVALVHSPALPPQAPYSRDWATGDLSPPSGPRGRTLLERAGNAITDLGKAVARRAAGKDVFVYRLRDFVPRFRFVDEVRAEVSGRGVLDALARLPADELRRIAFTEASASGPVAAGSYGSARILRWAAKAAEVDLEVDCSSRSFLAVAVNWSPSWLAEIDGRQAPVHRINHTQIGLEVPAGTHLVRLRYAPPYLPWARS